MLAPAQSKTPSKEENQRRRRSRPHGPGARWLPEPGAAQPAAPRTHPLGCRRQPAPPARVLGPEPGQRKPCRGGADRAQGARGAWLCSPGGPRPGATGGRLASPRPRVVPGAGQPGAPPHGRPPPPRRPAVPRPPCTGSRCAPIPRRAARAASGSGARGELWLEVCDPRAGSTLRRSLLPPPLRPPAVIWSRSCRPLAAAAGRAGPHPPPIRRPPRSTTGWSLGPRGRDITQ